MAVSRFLVLALLALRADAASPRKQISTWYDASDLDSSLAELRAHSGAFASLSLTAVGNTSTTDAQRATWMRTVTQELHIDTYMLWGGDLDSFFTSDARAATVTMYVSKVTEGGFTGLDLDFEHFPLGNASITAAYSSFLREMSAALHGAGRKLSSCAGSYPTAADGIAVFYDPAVLNETCDVVRVMNYDMYYVGGRGVPALVARPDCSGAGPTSTQPWARQSMEWWAARISPASKLVMGLPAYSNDYCALPHWGAGNGSQRGVGPPAVPAEAAPNSVESYWQFFDQIYVHRYLDATTGRPRVRYGTDARSTLAHLMTADTMGVRAVGLWTWNSADEAMAAAIYAWAGGGDGAD